jgi:hypothetical protein
MDTLTHDLRAVIRQWLHAPGLAMVAVVVMGLAAGGTLALFSLVDALTLRELPVKQPGQLVAISAVDPSQPTNTYPVPLSALQRLVDQQDVLSAVAGVGGAGITEGSAAERHGIAIDAVTGHYFDVLGVRPEAGRFITPEDVAASARVAVISHDYWQRRLGANPQVIGQTIATRRAARRRGDAAARAQPDSDVSPCRDGRRPPERVHRRRARGVPRIHIRGDIGGHGGV